MASPFQFIIDFFKEFSERRFLLKEFNSVAKLAFVTGATNRLLKAKTTFGDSGYHHSMSSMFSGFKIMIRNKEYISKEEVKVIGKVVLNNKILLRQLMSLGYDTLEVYGGDDYYHQWNMSAFGDLKNYYLR
jgi:hypothetical protein